MSSSQRNRRQSSGKLGYVLGVVCALVLISYGGTYYWLTRRERAKLDQYGIQGVLYVPIDEAVRTKDLSLHYRRARIFAPANWVDQLLFNGQGPTNITFGIQ